MLEALQWYVDQGVDEILLETPLDRTIVPDVATVMAKVPASRLPPPISKPGEGQAQAATSEMMMGAAQAIIEAQKLAQGCKTLEELRQAIVDFEGLSLKKTATNMVFNDGNPAADVMLIGEAPAANDDAEGKAFVGQHGQLLDKMLACIGLDRHNEDTSKAVYLSNILNWRPPGNRTPTLSEINISLPFIQRHIELAQPKMLILCGGVAGKSLLKRSETISKLRGNFYDYSAPEGQGGGVIPASVIYNPEYLLQTPSQKKHAWADLLMIQEKLTQI